MDHINLRGVIIYRKIVKLLYENLFLNFEFKF